MATPEEWLRQQLLALSSQGGTALDKEMVHGLVDYCARANDVDAAEFILNIVGDQARGIVDVYTAKRRPANNEAGSSSSGGSKTAGAKGGAAQAQAGRSLQAYIKPSLEANTAAVGSKKTGKGKKTEGKAENSATTGELGGGENRGPSEGMTSLGKVGRKKKAKGGKLGVDDVSAGRVLLANRKLCDCQARRHRLITNCLSCGKIICEQEGEGPCMFCGAMVSQEGGEITLPQGGGDEQLAVKLDAEEKARAFKDRLVEYDRTAAQRTAVIDDQSDFFQMDVDGDAWMSEEEKKKLRAQKALAAHEERERRSRVHVTFDLIGRRVILAGDEAEGSGGASDSATNPPETSSGEGPTPTLRIMPNPALKGPPPIFVGSAKDFRAGGSLPGGLRGGTTEADGQSKSEPRGKMGLLLGDSKGKPERVQHDSSYFGAIGAQLAGGLEGEALEVSDGGAADAGDTSGTVRLSGRDIDVEEFGSEPACGSRIPPLGAPVGKTVL